ncbi:MULTISPECIES: response regulator transcription factor [Pseudomonas]|jgi:DNA-binding NarL/FixJ family response regulator|uniref:LuxR family two component transcriptional regulator n=1 Tax=Pseudomonas putida TaxID=303 RepID=A0A9X8HIQ8_PSEPU|nr:MULTISPECIES: response regulator transcription factor [Pseudomonas]KIU51718.1 LuxR family transcriptional regulator [Pseudomonas putida]KTC19986.1 LuxR family transcriptional regulator [Pseudomonas putida]MBG8561356.1 response regulator transcription factor [Pseudomonas qingdaonensis]MCO7503836.1 response regulator transcription factor [Pseudomonas sp. VE 267-6A]MCO7530257.1 response regulator transcription factor [Pseudomonas sp. 2]
MLCRILLADESPLFRAGLRALLEQKQDYAVVGETGDGVSAVELAEQLKPDIIMLDMALDALESEEILRELCLRVPASMVLMLSARSELEFVMKCLQQGAHGFLLKTATVLELELALQALKNGGQYLSSAVLPLVIGQAVKHSRKRHAGSSTMQLTTRQLEILRLIARGESTRSIADGLGLSVKTVEAHRSQIMHRLQIHDIPGLVLFAVREGIIRIND